MILRIVLLLAVAVALVPARADSTVQPPDPDRFDLSRPEIKTFIDEMARKHALKRKDVSKLLSKAQPQPQIIEMMMKPAERVIPWYEYRARFLTDERITLGVQLWLDHRLELEDIAKQRGVPPEYLLAIIGVETKYGRITGRYRVIDALATLAFDYPPRQEFFRKELEEFVLLSREEKLDPLKTLGSYAGAMGNAQFMPSSYRKYAVDAQDDKKRDLWADWGDVFASIANYFREFGWQTGAPVMADVDLDPDPTFVMDTRNLTLNSTIESLAAQGVVTKSDATAATPAMLIFAGQADGPSYRVGFKNFEVITRYNRSPRYAMAVHDLAEAIAARMHEVNAPGSAVPPVLPTAPPTAPSVAPSTAEPAAPTRADAPLTPSVAPPTAEPAAPTRAGAPPTPPVAPPSAEPPPTPSPSSPVAPQAPAQETVPSPAVAPEPGATLPAAPAAESDSTTTPAPSEPPPAAPPSPPQTDAAQTDAPPSPTANEASLPPVPAQNELPLPAVPTQKEALLTAEPLPSRESPPSPPAESAEAAAEPPKPSPPNEATSEGKP